jgi:hypothetical protein
MLQIQSLADLKMDNHVSHQAGLLSLICIKLFPPANDYFF